MVTETMLPPPQELPLVGTTPCRSPVIVLDGIYDGAFPLEFVEEVASRSAHDVFMRSGVPKPVGACQKSPSSLEGLPAAWLEARDQFPAVCVGVVAVQDSGVSSASSILADCFAGGPGPGAIALLGFDHAFVETCFSLAEHLAGSEGGRMAGSADLMRHPPIEWPPMMIFLPQDHPSLAECALACRRLRAMDIPVHLEVMRSTRDGSDDAGLDELVGELDRFFAAHLVPRFPTIL